MSQDRTRKRWPFNTGDCMGRFDCKWEWLWQSNLKFTHTQLVRKDMDVNEHKTWENI